MLYFCIQLRKHMSVTTLPFIMITKQRPIQCASQNLLNLVKNRMKIQNNLAYNSSFPGARSNFKIWHQHSSLQFLVLVLPWENVGVESWFWMISQQHLIFWQFWTPFWIEIHLYKTLSKHQILSLSSTKSYFTSTWDSSCSHVAASKILRNHLLKKNKKTKW